MKKKTNKPADRMRYFTRDSIGDFYIIHFIDSDPVVGMLFDILDEKKKVGRCLIVDFQKGRFSRDDLTVDANQCERIGHALDDILFDPYLIDNF